MKKLSLVLFLSLCISSLSIAHEFKVLVFSKTAGFRHASIPDGITAIQLLGSNNGFIVDATEDASVFTYENLIQYDAVIFLSTTGDILNTEQQAAFEQYIQSGGGFVGIHSAADTEYNWAWYGGLVGAYFDSHPPGTPTATIKVADKVHPSTRFLPDYWERTDEWYNYGSNPRGDVHVLMTLNESSYSGGNMGYDHPIAWLHTYDGGRSWYTGGGHTSESFSEAEFLEHILGGIFYASGDVRGIYEGTADDKYQVTVLDNNPNDPMNLAVLPNLDVLYVERGGAIKLRDHATGLISSAGSISVESGREDGLLGIVLDPDFETNSWIYLFYSPLSAVEQRVSRFVYTNGQFDLSSEEILLKIPVQRDECCHSGGDLEFDGDGNLFITVGDNTNPFQSDGYNPIDERAGFEPWDAQRTSGNTNDLRGKILRIHPEDDGSYSIPDGNLFADSTAGLPEIFVMGTRNPFRMAVSKVTNELVWGDVGPDSRTQSASRGPVGYDEFNRTSTPGNFGWPYCIANNIPYTDYNFQTQTSGSVFDCSDPENDSPNNTGSLSLPPAQPAWLYYPYGYSAQRPEFGNVDARTAIGGDYFYFDSTKSETGSFPEYFDGTLFIAEWTRNWIKEVRFDSSGNLFQINPFLESLQLNRPIDLHFGPDGALYVIEWGTGFGGGNADARILKIEFTENLENRPPNAIAYANVTSGLAPLEVEFFGDRSNDPDDDPLTYSWDFDNDGTEDANTVNGSFTFNTDGLYVSKLTVFDAEGDSAVAQVEIAVGNTAPVVTIVEPLNGGFYEDFDTIDYKVSVSDPEQGTIGEGIDCSEIVAEPSIGHDDHAHGTGQLFGCEGSFETESHGDGPDNVFYVFNAQFTDDGGGIDAPLIGKGSVVLQRKIKQAEHAQEFIDVQAEETGDALGGGQNIGYINNNSALMFSPMNFEGIEFITLRYASLNNPADVEIRLDEVDGPLIGTVYTAVTGDWQQYDYFTSTIDNPGGTHDVYFVFKNTVNTGGIGNVNWIEFHGKGIAREDADSLRGLAASYYDNTDFSGTPVVRKDPMIAWRWDNKAPVDGVSENSFSVRWEGKIVPRVGGRKYLTFEALNGSATVWLDDEVILTSNSDSKAISFTAGEPRKLKVEYIHNTGDAGISLRWYGLGAEPNAIHSYDLVPDSAALIVPNEIDPDIPSEIALDQNYPNPFNPSTQIGFSIPKSGMVRLKVFNVLGQTVNVLVDQMLNQGKHSYTFNASELSSGIYFYQLEFNGKILSNRMLLLK